MTRTTKNSASVTNTSVSSVYQESSGSEQKTKMQDHPSLQPFTSQAHFVPPMFMPYIGGPKMEWMENDGLYHRQVLGSGSLSVKIFLIVTLQCFLH